MLSPLATEWLSLAFLLAVALAFTAAIAYWARRSNYSLAQCPVYLFGEIMTRVFWRASIEGRLEVPAGRGALIICNHRSPFDPAFIQLAADRVVHWMVAREYCEHPALAWMFRLVGAIPVGRGGIDTTATKLAIRYAQQGDMVGMLPEGRINTSGELLLPGRPGVALVALKARVPVIPCYVEGSPMGKTVMGSLLIPAKARLVIGRPIDISEFYGKEKEREVLEELTRRFLKEIAALAGAADYQPKLAGRHWKPE